jgi:hypothetical protein
MRIVALGLLVIFVCLSLIFGVFVIVRCVLYVLPYSVAQIRIVVDVLRVLLAIALAYVWLRVWKAITDMYFWRSVSVIKGRGGS